MCELNVASLNLIDGSTKTVNPAYDILGKFRNHKINVLMNHDGYLVIAATLDNIYCYWASLTKVEEKEKNAAIFDYISRVDEKNTKNFVIFSGRGCEGRFLEDKSFDCLKDANNGIDFSKWYETSFVLSAGDSSVKLIYGYGMGGYVDMRINNPGDFMARDVISLFNYLRKKCLFREASGVYGKVLDNYLEILEQEKDDPMYYVEIEALTKIIEDESYMLLSPNDELRKKYVAVCELKSMRYRFHMSAIR